MQIPDVVVRFVEEKMAEHRVPGVSVGLLLGEETAVSGYGLTSIDNPLPVTTNTLFQIGSNTKTMTATLLMLLAENGRLTLDTPIQKVLPDFRVQDETVSATATIRHLLTHSTGWVGDHFIDTGAGADAKAKYVASMADLPQLVPPGFAFSYNNSAFAVAGRLIEVITDMAYEAAMQKMLFAPLEMHHSFFDMADVMVRRFVVGHDVRPDEPTKVASPWPLPRAMYSVGAVTATAEDMLTYARFYLNGGKTKSGAQLLSPEAIKMMWMPQLDTASSSGAIAHSWFVQDEAGLTSYSHGGSTVGQRAAFKIVPAKQFAYVSLTNGSSGALFNRDLEDFLLREFCSINRPEPEMIMPSLEQLEALIGRYTRPMVDIELSLQDGQLMGQLIPKQGFPTADVPPEPPSPLFRCGVMPNGDLLALDGPAKGSQGQILRRADGSIGWLRFGLRLHQKENI